MTSGMRTLIYPVNDLAAAKRIYSTVLGVEPYVDQPSYVGFTVGDQEVGLDPNGHHNGIAGPVGYWHVDDIAGSVKAVVAAGAEVRQDITDVGGGKLIATVADVDGNIVGLLQAP